MRDKLYCRRCERIQFAGDRKSFIVPGSKPHYAPDLPFKLEHVLLDVTVDPKGKTLKGTATQRLRAVAPGQKSIRMDQIGLAIESVKVAGRNAEFETEGDSLRIKLASSPKPGSELEVAVRYSLRSPRRGLYFTGPDKDYPKKRYQTWSQGQDEDSRYWFPTFDYPNQKATSEIIAQVPKGFTAVSNGALLSRKDVGGGTRFHYKLGTPHVTYLITLAVAEFSEWEDKGPRGLPVQYFVEPGREADGRRAFGNTPKMIAAYEKKIGVPYAYEKYSQVAVQDFIFGGMENTSATTQTDLTLHDARAHLDFSSDPLVSHELAHQWFGDLLTCRDWSHGWLNEGFATFMERVWIEENDGPDGGIDEARYYQFQDMKDHLAEDTQKYRRPIVCNNYVEPIDLFDTHLYQKGGLVLNLIRHLLGEDAFWKSINLYVSRHRGGSVETIDLIRAIEETTGRNLRRVFDQWVFGAGYPEFSLSYTWHEDKKMAELAIEQKQASSGKDTGKDTQVFQLPVVIELTVGKGRDTKVVRQVIDLEEAKERVFIAAPSKPLMVRFDPGFNIPKTIKFPRPKEMLLYQLSKDEDVMGRIEAAKELGSSTADLSVVEALGRAALKDPFWGVQAEAASVLAEIRMDAARDALVAALVVRHPKARRAIVEALGTFKDSVAAGALEKLARKDPSYYVEASATLAWAQARFQPGAAPSSKELDEAEKFLFAQLKKDSYREVIRAASVKALAQLPGIERGERPQALEAILTWARRGAPTDARSSAILALGTVARSAVPAVRDRILGAFDHFADEDSMRVRMALVIGLKIAERPEGVGILEKIQANEIDGRVRRDAMMVVDHLRTAGTAPESVALLKDSLGKLEEEYRKLRSEFEERKAVSGSRRRHAE